MIFEIIITVAVGLVILIICLLHKPAKLWKDSYSFGDGSRRLGIGEIVLTRLGKNGQANISTIIFIRSKFLLTEVIVHRALVALSEKHPMLRMRLGKENGQYTYMKEIEDFEVDLEVLNTKDWKGLMEDEVPKIYDVEKGPLWKVKFLPTISYEDGEEGRYPYQAAFIFGFHHVIGDGPSYLRLFGELMEKLHAIKENEDHPVKSMPLLPPVDAYMDNAKVYSPQFNLKTNLCRSLNLLTSVPSILIRLLQALLRPSLFVKSLGVEIDRNPNAQKKTCIIPVELTKEQTSQLIAACKRHKTTVQCAIQIAACLAYSAMADGGKRELDHNINCRLSVNLRRFFTPPGPTDYFGLYFSLLFMNTAVRPALSFWNMVSKLGTDLQDALKSYVTFLVYNSYTIFANTDEEVHLFNAITAHLPGKRDADLDFHNYGNFTYLNRDENSHCKLSGFFITSNLPDFGSVFTNFLATVNGKLCWSFVYCSDITSKEQAQEFADMTIKTLLPAIKE